MVFDTGRPRVARRVMIVVLYLKHAFNESDEVGSAEAIPHMQFISGRAYFEHCRRCDVQVSQAAGRRRRGADHQRGGKAGSDPAEGARARVRGLDGAVRAVAHHTDCCLLETARSKLVEAGRSVFCAVGGD